MNAIEYDTCAYFGCHVDGPAVAFPVPERAGGGRFGAFTIHACKVHLRAVVNAIKRVCLTFKTHYGKDEWMDRFNDMVPEIIIEDNWYAAPRASFLRKDVKHKFVPRRDWV
jgi:hypothetical protein